MSAPTTAEQPANERPIESVPDDPDEFLRLVWSFDGHLRALAWGLLGDRDLMDDALQEAYLKAYRSRASYRAEAPFGAWLHRITTNTCLDLLRRLSRQRAESLDALGRGPAGESAGEPAREVASAAADPGEVAGLRTDLAAALAALPLEQRAAVLLVDVHGYDYVAAGRVLGVGKGTVGSRVSRGRAVLRRHLTHGEES